MLLSVRKLYKSQFRQRDVEGQQRGELKVFLPKIWFIFNYSEVCYPKKLRSKLLRNLKSVSLDSIYSECWVSHQHFRSIFQEMANPKLPFKNTCIKLFQCRACHLCRDDGLINEKRLFWFHGKLKMLKTTLWLKHTDMFCRFSWDLTEVLNLLSYQ